MVKHLGKFQIKPSSTSKKTSALEYKVRQVPPSTVQVQLPRRSHVQLSRQHAASAQPPHSPTQPTCSQHACPTHRRFFLGQGCFFYGGRVGQQARQLGGPTTRAGGQSGRNIDIAQKGVCMGRENVLQTAQDSTFGESLGWLKKCVRGLEKSVKMLEKIIQSSVNATGHIVNAT